jgi:hypothetical protein
MEGGLGQFRHYLVVLPATAPAPAGGKKGSTYFKEYVNSNS